MICTEHGLLQVGGVKAGPVQLQKRQGVDGVILQLPLVGRLTGPVTQVQAVAVIRHPGSDQLVRPTRRLQIAPVQNPSTGQGQDGPGIPGQQHLVVQVKPGSSPAVAGQPL